MLVLKVLDDGPLHGYAIAVRLQRLSKEVLSVEEDRSIRRCTGWSGADGCRRRGR
jgi:hypothetical protein